ncbi:MAG: demethoxyubiquinone hydroxylase family protein [Burkholderiaceae bacterium]|jgi:demethoxyubiquinone hydroxylase (CLK1/Coq7/Cat5 family)|nr:demethoxyubiquinone hydroxylase family protein [Burkholderiaceae bacterium]MCZ8174610.1 demethoxyubiquinone hydroxylase family protein [Burkholderiaceae bacterium]
MTPQDPHEADTLTVLYDGGCPLCRREIAHVQGLSQRQGDAGLCFVDISADAACDAAERAALLARFHVQRGDGTRLDGAAAFVAMWQRLPGWRWLARAARLPGALPLLEAAYRGFLRVRPALQRLAWRWEPTPGLSQHLERELRSDHAGETGAVFIYRGIAAVARWRGQRGDAELLAFAQRHGQAEAEHLRLVEEWLPRHRRSHLLGPWRLAGWLTGALPALAGARAVHATIAAVETFVDRHYQQQIDHIASHGAPEGLLPLLLRCQADECHHRDEATALAAAAGPVPWPLRAWCAVVGQGSAAAVVLARRV